MVGDMQKVRIQNLILDWESGLPKFQDWKVVQINFCAQTHLSLTSTPLGKVLSSF